MMKKFLCVILALVMALSLVACGSEQEPVDTTVNNGEADAFTFVMGIDPEYPPFSYLGDDGEYTGFDVEICKAACDLLGWNFEVFGVNWDEKLVQLDSMKEAGYTLSAPYFYNAQVIMVKEGSDIKSSADLAGKVVAVQLGTSGEAMLAEDGDQAELAASFGELMTCDSFLKCFTELAGGAADAVFVDLPVAAAYAAENEGFTIINENLGAEEYGIAFRGDQDGQGLCNFIEDAVAQLVENGTYAKIAEKYPDIVENLIFLQ